MVYQNFYTHTYQRQCSGKPYGNLYAGAACGDGRGGKPYTCGADGSGYAASCRSSVPLPQKLMLCISDQCNFSCNMCTFRPGKLKPLMHLEDWKRVVDDTAKAEVDYVFFGGEPLLYPRFDELVEYIGRAGNGMCVVTNGFYLDRHLDVLLKNRCQIVLSMDGVGRVHDNIRGCGGSFARLEDTLYKLYTRYGPEERALVSVNSVLLPENAESVNELIDYLYGFGVGNVSFQHLQFCGHEEQEQTDILWKDIFGYPFRTSLVPRKVYEFAPADVRKIQAAVAKIQQAALIYKDMGIYINPDLTPEETALYYSPSHTKLAYKSQCLNPWTSAMIASDGKVNLCLDACVGSLLEKDFWSVWYGKVAEQFREGVSEHLFPVCTRCCNFYNSYIRI